MLNAYDTTIPADHINIVSLNATAPNDITLIKKADQQIYISFDIYNIDNYDFHRKHLYGYYQGTIIIQI